MFCNYMQKFGPANFFKMKTLTLTFSATLLVTLYLFDAINFSLKNHNIFVNLGMIYYETTSHNMIIENLFSVQKFDFSKNNLEWELITNDYGSPNDISSK